MNLLKETIEVLKEHGKTEKDVLWVGCEKFYTDWEHFKKIADVEYDNGFGEEEVACDLLVVGEDFWLEREEYDGSEWWIFREFPQKPKKRFDFSNATIRQFHKKFKNAFRLENDLETLNTKPEQLRWQEKVKWK